MGWMEANKLTPDKMEVLLVGSNSFLRSDYISMLAEVALTPKTSVHSLGILLDLGLLLCAPVATVARSAYCQLELVYQL